MNAMPPHRPDVFSPFLEPAARQFCGAVNERMSSDTNLRFGTNGSLSVEIGGDKRGVWFNQETGEHGGVLDLLRTYGRLEKPAALDWLRAQGAPIEPKRGGGKIVATYDYRAADGALLFQVLKYQPKTFRQRRPDGNGGWTWSTKGVERVPYRLPELLDAFPGDAAFVTEGEKDADALIALGLVATCNAGGAGKWFPDLSAYFQGRDVVILPDNDEAGEEHARTVAMSLTGLTGSAASVKILRLPDLPQKGDVSDWLEAGGNRDLLLALVQEAAEFDRSAPPPETPNSDTPRPNEDVLGLNEDAIAVEFVDNHADHLRYDHDLKAWFEWTGSHWRQDRHARAFSWARLTCRRLRVSGTPSEQAKLARASVAAAVERFAQADPRIAVDAHGWDQDGWLLGTPDGTVDLRTGFLRPADRADLITKQTLIAPALPGTPHPIWSGFLLQATRPSDTGPEDALRGDELIAFLQRLAGYCLTGDVSEEKLAFLYGEGGTGKGTFLGTMTAILADYTLAVPTEAFAVGSRINLDYVRAKMHGARLVTASETEAGTTWSESAIKELTGNETKIPARHPYGRMFNYSPLYKILFVGNHAPKLKTRSEAMKRRLRIVPFAHKPQRIDEALKEKLRTEYPAILRWMITGCLAWQRDRLGTCDLVEQETDGYFEQQDTFGRWMLERCSVGNTLSEKPSKLLADFVGWAKQNGESTVSPIEFRELVSRTPGLRYTRTKGNQLVRGIGLRPSEDEAAMNRARYGERD